MMAHKNVILRCKRQNLEPKPMSIGVPHNGQQPDWKNVLIKC